jgi:hypothetical protein
MKRAGYLLERIAEPENLREAFLRASRAKSAKPDVVAFRQNLTGHLLAMRDQILSGEVLVGGYRQFRVYDPKERVSNGWNLSNGNDNPALCRGRAMHSDLVYTDRHPGQHVHQILE